MFRRRRSVFDFRVGDIVRENLTIGLYGFVSGVGKFREDEGGAPLIITLSDGRVVERMPRSLDWK
jgi:hypothetical protein